MSSFDLTSWLAGAGLERLEGALRSNEVLSADDLFGLSEADIRELAPVMGVRNRFMRAIAALRDVEGAGGVSAPQGVSTGKTIVFSKAPPTPARTPGTPRTPTAKRGARRTSRPAERSVYTAEPRQLVLRRTVSPGPTGLGVGGGGGGGVGVSGRASFGVDNSYIAERRRREAERTELRKQTLVQERERWLQLLQRTVSRQHVDCTTERKRKEAAKQEEARRRSLSRSLSYSKQQRQQSASGRRPDRKRAPSDGELRSALYNDIACAYESFADPQSVVLGSPQRRRVWSRDNEPVLFNPPMLSPGGAVFDECSPSPPPPPGSPSPLQASPGTFFYRAGSIPPPQMPTLHDDGAVSPDVYAAAPQHAASPEHQVMPDSEEHRSRLLSLIEDQKQQRYRHWVGSDDSVSFK